MIFTLVVMALATWRLSNLLADTRQSGPFDLLDRLRSKLGVRFNQMGEAYGTNSIAKGALCIFCNSVWFGIGLTVLFYFFPVAAFYLSVPFALSAAAIFANKVVDP